MRNYLKVLPVITVGLIVSIGSVAEMTEMQGPPSGGPALIIPERPAEEPLLIPDGITISSITAMGLPSVLEADALLQVQQMDQQGFVDVGGSEDLVFYTKKQHGYLMKTMTQVTPKLALQPSDLNGTPFDKAAFIGARAVGGLMKAGWTGLERIYRFPAKGIVKFEELDLVASGGGIVISEESINESINDGPGMFLVQTGLNNKAISMLTWFNAEQTKMYTLTAGKKMVRQDAHHQLFMRIANAIN